MPTLRLHFDGGKIFETTVDSLEHARTLCANLAIGLADELPSMGANDRLLLIVPSKLVAAEFIAEGKAK